MTLSDVRLYKSVGKDILLDYRIEFTALMTAYAAASNMYWTGYTAFFAVNTLLVTAFGVSYSSTVLNLPAGFLDVAHYLISLVGMLMAVIASYASYLIMRHQTSIVKRGCEIEQSLATRSFGSLAEARSKFPWATVIGSAPFFFLWAAALYFAI